MQAWEKFLNEQELEIGTDTVKKWLRSLKVLNFDACNLHLEAKDSFQALWFEEHIRKKASERLFNGNHKKIKIHLTLASLPAPAAKPGNLRKKQKPTAPPLPFEIHFDTLDPQAYFHNYILREDNRLTYELLLELGEGKNSLGQFNPVFLYGHPGSGKTHLLMSLAHHYQKRQQKCLYVRAELFTDHFVAAIRAGEMHLFRQAYRNVDVLIVDDIHVLSRKSATQEEFFHTFNALHLDGKQIVLSANCSPQELQLIEPRLVSRFEWGIVLPLKPLENDDLKKMIHAKSAAMQLHLPTSVIKFLTDSFTTTPKALIKAFEALILRIHLDAQHSIENLTVSMTKTLLSDFLIEEQESMLTYSKIIRAVAEHYGIREEDILGKSQTRDCVLPRQIAMHLCREKLKMPFMKIGDLFGKDHSTVMTSVKLIQNRLQENNLEISRTHEAILKNIH